MPADSPSLVNMPGPGPAFSTMSARAEANPPIISERVGDEPEDEATSISIPSGRVRPGSEHYSAAGGMGIPSLSWAEPNLGAP